MEEKAITFSPEIEEQLERLGIRKKEDFPAQEEWFMINDEQSFEIPLPITQLLWGYDWEAYELHLTPEGRTALEFGEDEDPIFIFSTKWTESGSVFWGKSPCLCVGRVLGIPYMDTLLIQLDLSGHEDPALSVRMPQERHWLGYLDDFSRFLPYTVAEPAKGASEEVQKKINEAFSEVISSFVNALQLDAGAEREEKIKHFNRLCNQFFANNPTASIASIADGLVQLGVPYETAIKDVTWARTFGE